MELKVKLAILVVYSSAMLALGFYVAKRSIVPEVQKQTVEKIVTVDKVVTVEKVVYKEKKVNRVKREYFANGYLKSEFSEFNLSLANEKLDTNIATHESVKDKVVSVANKPMWKLTALISNKKEAEIIVSRNLFGNLSLETRVMSSFEKFEPAFAIGLGYSF
jgi:hypothetical protein